MIHFMKRMRDAPRRRILLAGGLSLLLLAGCFFILHGTLPLPPRAVFRADSDCWQLHFAPDSNTLVTAGGMAPSDCWEVRFPLDSHKLVTEAWPPRGNPVQVWDVATGGLRYTVVLSSLGGSGLGIDGVHLSPDSRLLALDSLDEGLRVLDLQTGRELAHWEPASSCQCMGFALAGRYVAIEDVVREKGLIRLWDPRTQTEIGQIESYFTGDELPSHGRNLATHTGGESGKVKIRLWQLPDRGPPVVTKEMVVPGQYVAITSDLTRFATCITNGGTQIAVWDTATGQRLCSIPDERVKPLPDIFFAGDGRLLVECVPLGTLRSGIRTKVWNLTSAPTPTAILSTKECRVDFSADGKWLALPGDLEATLIDADTREKRDLLGRGDVDVRSLLGGFYQPRPAFSPDSQVLAVAGLHQQARDPLPDWLPARLHRLFDSPGCVTHFWDTPTGREQEAILPGRRALFSPDGLTLLTVDEDFTIRLWNFPLRRPLAGDLGLSALLWLTLMLLAGVGQVSVRMVFRLVH